jgi:hypothetical protein
MFLRKNWKAFVFPVLIVYIILFDLIIFEELTSFTFGKIFFVSFLHVLLVLKTKYIYDSEIYAYYTNAFISFDLATAKYKFLSKQQSKFCFISVYVGLILVSIEPCQDYTTSIIFILVFPSSLLIVDSVHNLYVIHRSRINWSLLETPHNLHQLRFLPSPKAIVLGTAICHNIVKISLGAFTGSEIILPLVMGGPNNIGPITKAFANSKYSDASTCGVETRGDIVRDHAWSIDQKNLKNGSITPENALPQRTSHLQVWMGK